MTQKESSKGFEQFMAMPETVWLPLLELLQQSHLSIESWTPEMASALYEQLEHPNWAPWLEASPTTMAGRSVVFPEGQLVIKDQGCLAASLSMNRIQWNGVPATLPNWDQVAGIEVTDYSQTYQPAGNTLVMMSMNVAPEAKGKQLPTKMIDYVKLLAQHLGIEHVIGSFRPSGYGVAKKVHEFDLPFWQYCFSTQTGSDKPVDPWLRSLWWNGMQMIQEDPQAMQVTVSLAEFELYKRSYKTDAWVEVTPGVWECEEVGSWQVSDDSAVYTEANVWGVIPLT